MSKSNFFLETVAYFFEVCPYVSSRLSLGHALCLLLRSLMLSLSLSSSCALCDLIGSNDGPNVVPRQAMKKLASCK